MQKREEKYKKHKKYLGNRFICSTFAVDLGKKPKSIPPKFQ